LLSDIVDTATRSRMMSGIRGKDTRPELFLRKGLHARGFRFRLHDRKLPGRPDLAFPRRKAVIFVHGCFWHGHDCHLFRWPSTREAFWQQKIEGNRERDARATEELRDAGWRVLAVWECALKGRLRLAPDQVLEQVSTWLRSGSSPAELRGGTSGDC
jgi:DNA mismatch endonuclease, patch repair protein